MIQIYQSVEDTVKGIAEHLIQIGRECIIQNGSFTLVLSGGSSPKKLYELLASENYKNKLNWTQVYFFFGDERNVSKDDPGSNYRMIKEAFFDPLAINTNNIFSFDTSLIPHQAAEVYQETLSNFFKDKEYRFDLILLGLGDNSHTASLFPYTEILRQKIPLVSEVFLPDQSVFRLSFNAPLINLATHISFLVYGSLKAPAVKHVLKDEINIEEFPAQLIAPDQGEITWFLDKEAASLIDFNS